MSSKVPEILDALQARLQTVAPVYRALEGRALPISPKPTFPLIALRLGEDQAGTKIIAASVTTLALVIEGAVAEKENVFIDAELANLLWGIRTALVDIDETTPLSKLIHSGGLQFSTAIYGYPESGSQYAIVRQPITIRLTEDYRS